MALSGIEMNTNLDLQPFVVERLEVTYFVDRRRICTETITERWLIADLSYTKDLKSIDHYKVRARYQGVQAGEERPRTEILPMLNCRAGVTEVQEDGWLTAPMYFPAPLHHNERVFFASRVKHHANIPMYPAAFLQVTSLGIINLIMRVQFDPSAVPAVCWVYGGPNAADVTNESNEESRLHLPNELGYVEYQTENCPPGWCYTIRWKWNGT